uniref:Uncharacterized protein n=1 Tax=Brassica oleracea TaxID=3712 RepID=A0A3P6H7C3_BRAOL|nr:unnamed protein product [Brassica oleracea]
MQPEKLPYGESRRPRTKKMAKKAEFASKTTKIKGQYPQGCRPKAAKLGGGGGGKR